MKSESSKVVPSDRPAVGFSGFVMKVILYVKTKHLD